MDNIIQPQAIELEKLVLGAILLEISAFDRVSGILTSNSFYMPSNRLIYNSCKKIKRDNKIIDFITLIEYLKKDSNLDAVGGVSAIAELTNNIHSSANIEQHARIIKEKELRRELILIATKSLRNAYNDTVDIFDNLLNASLGTSNLLDVGNSKQVEKLNDLILFNHKDRLIEKTGQKSKFAEVQDYEDGKLYIIAGRPAMGKTTFVINESYHFSKQDKAVLFFSLEMAATEIATKIESLESRIPSYRLSKNKIYRDEEQKYEQLTLLDTNFYIDDTPAINLQHIKAKANKLSQTEDLGMVVVDYLQLMKGETKGNREQEISSITRGLKELSKSLKVPIIALSQLSRAVESRPNKRPMLSDLRESGSIEQDADLVGFLFRPYYYAEQSGDAELINGTDKNLAEYIIAKNRAGSVGKIELNCDLSISEFTDRNLPSNATNNFHVEDAPF